MPKTPQSSRVPSEKSGTPNVGLSFRQTLSKQGNQDRVVLVMVDDDEDDCLLVS